MALQSAHPLAALTGGIAGGVQNVRRLALRAQADQTTSTIATEWVNEIRRTRIGHSLATTLGRAAYDDTPLAQIARLAAR